MPEQKEASCTCHAIQEVQEIVQQHTVQLTKHEERLGRGNIEFAVISTKLNIIMAILAAVGVAVCGAVISIIL
ncbi:MAG: hypothetical protein Q4P20_11415 [Eubacteriales bacterium]|nr:hypothetical protein [Eubacteriales bacterium]